MGLIKRCSSKILHLKGPAVIILAATLLAGCYTFADVADARVTNSLPLRPETKAVALHLDFRIVPTGEKSKFDLTVLLPRDYVEHQRVVSETYSVEPSKIIVDGENRYAIFHSDSISAPQTISLDFDIEIYRYDWATVSKRIDQVENLKVSGSQNYTTEEKFLQTNHPILIRKAKELVGQDEKSTVSNIHHFVAGYLKYNQYEPEDKGAFFAYTERRGDCTEFTDLFLTLCRIDNIPARFMEGYIVLGSEKRHDWVEVYFKDLSWIPFDPTWSATDQVTTFESLRNMYIYMSMKRNDTVLNGYHYYAYRYSGSPLSVSRSARIFLKN